MGHVYLLIAINPHIPVKRVNRELVYQWVIYVALYFGMCIRNETSFRKTISPEPPRMNGTVWDVKLISKAIFQDYISLRLKLSREKIPEFSEQATV